MDWRDLDWNAWRDIGDHRKPSADPLVVMTGRQLMFNLLGLSAKPGHGYLSRNYGPARDGNLFIRHTGFDIIADIGDPVRAVAPGKVYRITGSPRHPLAQAIFVESPRGTTWIYGHLNERVRVGSEVDVGDVIGKISDPRGLWNTVHLHFGTYRRRFPFDNDVPDEDRQRLGWGRARGRTVEEAEKLAEKYVRNPVLSYALVTGIVR